MAMDSQLRAISDPTRRAILHHTASGELTAGEIAAKFKLTRPAVSQHLKKLLATNLLDVRREGTRRLYRANETELTALKLFLDAFWDDNLPALKSRAETVKKRKGKTRRRA